MSSEIDRAMVIVFEPEERKPIRKVVDRVLRPNKWKRSCHPVERFVIETADALGYSHDASSTNKLCIFLDRADRFRQLRMANQSLDEATKKELTILIKQKWAGITSKKPHTNRALDVIIPIAKAFFSHQSSVIVAIGLFVERLVEHVSKMRPTPPALKPLLQRSERKLAEGLRTVLDKGSYCESKSGKGAEILVDQFIASKLIDFCPEPVSA
ncbi:hypothetical protein ACPF37_002876 [Vibrio cholerae]|uniref:hypothetical protein n=1 Tax=Vibrio cholerae TaxID=666 RepID=UPI000A81CC42|nr:hypothetical protein [Vibrio cholerae]MCR9705804.1 hypothetical protein [Vibrio cholerae]MCR9870133.1 hypothetical protein [Vibrio cholerae]BCK14977.1 hypothetical protein VCSRO45_2580 [Vibrio cholerae]GHW27684.1 hypothetical protein VCSRO150_2334 [Vibrio cholerae]GHX99186.1 hypothetical protein VCSRO210_2903 [Vibrio cholerae]